MKLADIYKYIENDKLISYTDIKYHEFIYHMMRKYFNKIKFKEENEMIGKRKSKLLAVGITLAISVLMPLGNVKAVLQANPNTHYKKVDGITNWMSNMRKMEESGNAMGLSETFKSDLTASSKSNNIDVHMMKSTEYGAIAILSASGYGNLQTLQNSSVKTTTGNKTGVYFSENNWEFVAGGYQEYIFKGVNEKYYDIYTSSNSSARVGDALGNQETTNPGCSGWHSAPNSNWAISRGPYFVRGKGGLFSFLNTYFASQNYFARGVAVAGAGL